MRIQLGEQFHIIVSSTKEESVVHVALLGRQSVFLFQSLQRCGLGHGVGHIEIGGHPSCSGSLTLAVDVSFLRQTWLTEMYMIVDDAW